MQRNSQKKSITTSKLRSNMSKQQLEHLTSRESESVFLSFILGNDNLSFRMFSSYCCFQSYC